MTKDIKPFAVVKGVPAKQSGWVSKAGNQLVFNDQGKAFDSEDKNLLSATQWASPMPINDQIVFVDLPQQYQHYKQEIDDAIAAVVSTGQFVKGHHVKAFEQSFAEYLGVSHVIGCGSGTDALLLALMAIDLQPGDEVIVPAFSYIASASMVAFLGAKLVFVDIDADTFNLDTAKLGSR